ncbi:FabD/lysophospholipase-like protein [Armillaria gallica]|uniref:FabD/lysophospholipase-like protein n=1 Tax=Armillaria gallica TaxID=47427 RepID=A0A2H3CPR3_ARMGA|nr:FabD/lysophospholipase-like protein [Armillaria gallica]
MQFGTATPISPLHPLPESSTRPRFWKGTLHRTNTQRWKRTQKTSRERSRGLLLPSKQGWSGPAVLPQLSMAVHAGPSILSDLPVNLLSLDGGGIRGVSELFILDEIMKRIQLRKNLPIAPKLCDYLNLIGGTSTGGLIAIMLGRLKMSTDEALQSYNKISNVVFSAENRKPFYSDGKFKATTLEREIKNVVHQAGYSNNQKLLDPDVGPNSKGNTVSAHIKDFPTKVRTARYGKLRVLPQHFKAIEIAGLGGFGPNYVDAGLGFSNPTKEVRDGAKELFGASAYPSASGQAILVLVLKRIMTDCESVADELAKEYGSDDAYFRFNVLHGAEGVSLDEWKKMSEVMAHTSSYLRGPEVSREIDRVVAYLCSSLPRTK